MATTDYDPSEHTNQEVLDYLAGADADELQRVLALESGTEGRKRVGILRQLEPEPGATVSVTLQHHWTDADGTAYAPGATIDVPEVVGAQLVGAHYATSTEVTDADPTPKATTDVGAINGAGEGATV